VSGELETSVDDLKGLYHARAHWLPRSDNGKMIGQATIYRWISQGVCGVKLEALRMGGRTLTTQAAVQTFLREVDAAKQRKMSNQPEQPGSTEDELRAAGLLK